MAGSSSILKQFLVALGFKVDQFGLGRYNAAVQKTDTMTRNLGRAAIWAAATVVASVAIIARQLEKLYFTSLKTGDSADNIQAWAFGMGAAGISAEKARSMLEGFSLELLKNPGKQALLRNLGVTAQTTAEQLDQLVAVLAKKFPGDRAFFARAAFAEQFGVSPDDLRLMERTMRERGAAEREQRKVTNEYGVDLKQAVKDAHELDRAIAGIGIRFQAMATNFASAMMPTLTEWAKEFSGLLDTSNALFMQIMAARAAREAGTAPKPGEVGYDDTMPQGNIGDIARVFILGLREAARDFGGAHLGFSDGGIGWSKQDVLALRDRVNADAQARNPQVRLVVTTSDPNTTVEVDDGRQALGQGSVRNFGTPAR